MVVSTQGGISMKKKIFKDSALKELLAYILFLLIVICFIAVCIRLKKNLLIYFLGVIMLFYIMAVAFSSIKCLFCVEDLNNNYRDYTLDLNQFHHDYIEKKNKIDCILHGAFEWSMIGFSFGSALFIILGVFLDKMVLALVIPGWLASLLLIFSFVRLWIKKINHQNDPTYTVKKCLARISESSIYYKGTIYLINRMGFVYEDSYIKFFKIKIKKIDLSLYQEIDNNIDYAVSACLLGENVKYNGGNNLRVALKKLYEMGKCISVCPEVLGGRDIPRKTTEIKDGIVIEEDGTDVTNQFILGANLSLEKIIMYNVKRVILKAKSPSCGVGIVYDGSFSHTIIAGDGITTQLLKKNGIDVIDDVTFLEEINNGKEC